MLPDNKWFNDHMEILFHFQKHVFQDGIKPSCTNLLISLPWGNF